MTPDAYVYRGTVYPVRLQLRYMPHVAIGFPTCPKRNPCAGCAKKRQPLSTSSNAAALE